MAVRTWAAFAAGVAVGWAGRQTFGSGRELVVRGVVALHGLRERVMRVAAEHVELAEDMFAEGRARYETKRATRDDEDARAPRAGARSGDRAA
jgi:hypothetical protein